MCGRYVRRSDKQKIAEWFHAEPQPAGFPLPDADYNVAPTTHQPIIRQNRDTGNREMVLARWGLVPFFTTDLKDLKGLSTINARAESIAKAPTWREPFKKRRCLVPASAFLEWPKQGKPPKQPYLFELANGNPLAFAGLWDAWKDKDGHWLQSFAIVTTEANELLGRIHPDAGDSPTHGITIAGSTGKRRNGCRSTCCGPLNPKRWRPRKRTHWSTMCGTTDRR